MSLLLVACEDDADSCNGVEDCAAGENCYDGQCRAESTASDGDRRRGTSGPDTRADSSPSDGDGGAAPEVTSIEEMSEDTCALNCGDSPADSEPADSALDSPDVSALLGPECLGFCQTLCSFLEECGKHDDTCVTTCAQSPRYQQLSAAACTEGSHVIGLEACALWLDCGGDACALDEMCLEIIPGLSYQCAPICDRTQSLPACPPDVDCAAVVDANGSNMSSIGMCWSLY
jgi:hypothetical protein